MIQFRYDGCPFEYYVDFNAPEPEPVVKEVESVEPLIISPVKK
jgi:hypothetical protein